MESGGGDGRPAAAQKRDRLSADLELLLKSTRGDSAGLRGLRTLQRTMVGGVPVLTFFFDWASDRNSDSWSAAAVKRAEGRANGSQPALLTVAGEDSAGCPPSNS